MKKKERLGSDPLDFMSDEISRQEMVSLDPDKTDNGESFLKNNRGVIPAERKEEKEVREVKPPVSVKTTKKEKKMSTGDIIEAKNLKIKRDDKGEGKINLNFDGEMTIYSVEKVKELILENLADAKSLEADMSRVSRIDSSVFQLFLLAMREAEEEKKSFKIVNPSQETRKLFNLYGEGI